MSWPLYKIFNKQIVLCHNFWFNWVEDEKASLRAKWDSSNHVCLAVNASKRFDPFWTESHQQAKLYLNAWEAFYNDRAAHLERNALFTFTSSPLFALSKWSSYPRQRITFLPVYVNGHLLKQFRLNALFAAGYVNNISQPGFEPLTPLCLFFSCRASLNKSIG